MGLLSHDVCGSLQKSSYCNMCNNRVKPIQFRERQKTQLGADSGSRDMIEIVEQLAGSELFHAARDLQSASTAEAKYKHE